MKYLLVFCIVICGPVRLSFANGLPTNVCVDFCGPAQQDIWNRFENATGLKLLLIPSVYSGTCYHKSPAYDPHTPQFGGLLLDKVNGQVIFDGKFSFYKQEHPYAHLSVETARERFPELREVALFDGFAYAEASDPLKPFRYWFRQDADSDGLLVVGYFGYRHTILCALDRHLP